MCEPEAIKVMHGYSASLRALFLHFARMEFADHAAAGNARRLQSAGSVALCVETSEADFESDSTIASELDYELEKSDEEYASHVRGESPAPSRRVHFPSFSPSASPRLSFEAELRKPLPGGTNLQGRRSSRSKAKRQRMTQHKFEHMLQALCFFPEFVQLHSMRKHISMTFSRRKCKSFTYPAFVECLTRIAFMHLDLYGNTVQQNASSQSKCFWLLAMLRHRCHKEGISFRSNEADENKLWTKRQEVKLEAIPFKQLVFWRTMDGAIDQDRLRLINTTNRPGPVLSMDSLPSCDVIPAARRKSSYTKAGRASLRGSIHSSTSASSLDGRPRVGLGGDVSAVSMW